MIVRKYRIGDENGIEFTDVAAKEWGGDGDAISLYCLHHYESYTIIDGEYKNVCCFVPVEDGSEYVFFVKDRRSSSLVMKYYKQILNKRTCRVWSYAQPGQDKMHRFFNMVKTNIVGDLEKWEVLDTPLVA